MNTNKIRVAVVGASGYSGQELLRLLARHKGALVVAVTSTTKAGQTLDTIVPAFKNIFDITLSSLELDGKSKGEFSLTPADMADVCDVVFLCVPHTKAIEITLALTDEKLLDGKKAPVIIDISADYRLSSPEEYKKWYNTPHLDPKNLERAVYGLVELHRKEIKGARLIANPGCYATASILGLFPAVKAGLCEKGISIDAKSGISGAGKTPAEHLHFPEMNENIQAYKIGTHRHTAEIIQELKLGYADADNFPELVFVPHIVPLTRGIYATIYARTDKNVTDAELTKIYEDFYADSTFVRITDPNSARLLPVANTNFCDITVRRAPGTGTIVITSSIDNLTKGAAGQAVQNMNVIFDFDEKEGLL